MLAIERGADPSLAPLLAACSDRIALHMGLHYPPEKWSELARAISAAAPELGCADLRDCLKALRDGPLCAHRQEVLAHHLTIGETYFFRDPAVFAALREHILPPLVRARSSAPSGPRCLRVWSAGCSTGEEAYSLAITLLEMLPKPQDWQLTILASDINVQALARARQGVYSDWSFRNASPDFKARYFTRTGEGRYRIDPQVQAMVSFVPLNLARDVYPAIQTNTTGMDIVFCRNVLMYLRDDQAAAAIERLAGCLAAGGWLAVSPVETPIVGSDWLQAQPLAGAVLFRKRSALAGTGTMDSPQWPALEEAGRPRGKAPGARARPPRAVPGTSTPGTVEEAQAHYRQGHYPEAVALLERILARDGGHGQASLLLARSLANLGRLDEALHWSDRALAADPLDPARSYLRGSILLEQGQLEAATVAFQRALYLDHDFPLAHFALGSLLVRRGRAALAASHYERARAVLRRLPPDSVLPEADGISAARMLEMIDAIGDLEATA